jgi:hypothetical protein
VYGLPRPELATMPLAQLSISGMVIDHTRFRDTCKSLIFCPTSSNLSHSVRYGIFL